MNFANACHSSAPKNNNPNGDNNDFELFPNITRKNAVIIETLDHANSQDYAIAISEVIGAENIIACGKQNNKVLFYLKTVAHVEQVSIAGIGVHGQFLHVTPLVKPTKRVIVSNVTPEIPDYLIRRRLERYGTVVSNTTPIQSNLKGGAFRHVKCLRRQVYMRLDERFNNLNDSFEIQYENMSYKIFVSVDGLTCFYCHAVGHILRNCPKKRVAEADTDRYNDNEETDIENNTAAAKSNGDGFILVGKSNRGKQKMKKQVDKPTIPMGNSNRFSHLCNEDDVSDSDNEGETDSNKVKHPVKAHSSGEHTQAFTLNQLASLKSHPNQQTASTSYSTNNNAPAVTDLINAKEHVGAIKKKINFAEYVQIETDLSNTQESTEDRNKRKSFSYHSPSGGNEESTKRYRTNSSPIPIPSLSPAHAEALALPGTSQISSDFFKTHPPDLEDIAEAQSSDAEHLHSSMDFESCSDTSSILSEIPDLDEKLENLQPQMGLSLTPPTDEELVEFLRTLKHKRKPISDCLKLYPDLRVLLRSFVILKSNKNFNRNAKQRLTRLINTLVKHLDQSRT